MLCAVVTLFPEMFSVLNYGIVGRAIDRGILELDFCNPRDFTSDPHRTVDDRPYGGGPGMVMKVEPLLAAINSCKEKAGNDASVICMSPQGKKVSQKDLVDLALDNKNLIFVSGRYEGIDERIYDLAIDQEWSIGDYVLSGGELAVMVVIDALTRLLPNALGHQGSAKQDSFIDGLLDCPHYTRPENINGHTVPEVLLSGDHKEISKWRLKQQLGRTLLRRPDLLKDKILSNDEENLLTEFIKENGGNI